MAHGVRVKPVAREGGHMAYAVSPVAGDGDAESTLIGGEQYFTAPGGGHVTLAQNGSLLRADLVSCSNCGVGEYVGGRAGDWGRDGGGCGGLRVCRAPGLLAACGSDAACGSGCDPKHHVLPFLMPLIASCWPARPLAVKDRTPHPVLNVCTIPFDCDVLARRSSLPPATPSATPSSTPRRS